MLSPKYGKYVTYVKYDKYVKYGKYGRFYKSCDDSTPSALSRSRYTKSPVGNLIDGTCLSQRGWYMNWQSLLRQEQSMKRAEGGSHVPLRTSDHRDYSCGKKAGAEDSHGVPPPIPRESPPLLMSRDPRLQAAQRAHPGPCARRTAVGSRDALSRDQRVRCVDAKSGAGAGVEEHVSALIPPGSSVT